MHLPLPVGCREAARPVAVAVGRDAVSELQNLKLILALAP